MDTSGQLPTLIGSPLSKRTQLKAEGPEMVEAPVTTDDGEVDDFGESDGEKKPFDEDLAARRFSCGESTEEDMEIKRLMQKRNEREQESMDGSKPLPALIGSPLSKRTQLKAEGPEMVEAPVTMDDGEVDDFGESDGEKKPSDEDLAARRFSCGESTEEDMEIKRLMQKRNEREQESMDASKPLPALIGSPLSKRRQLKADGPEMVEAPVTTDDGEVDD